MSSPDPMFPAGSPKFDATLLSLLSSPVGDASLRAGESASDCKKELSVSAADTALKMKSSVDDSKSVTTLGITWTKLNPNLSIPGLEPDSVVALAEEVNNQFDSLSKAFDDAKTLRVKLKNILISRQMVLLDTGDQVGTDEERPSRFYKMIDLVRGQNVILIDPNLAMHDPTRGSPRRARDCWRVKRDLMFKLGDGDTSFPETISLFPLKEKSSGDQLADFGAVQIEYAGELFTLLDEGTVTDPAQQKLMCTKAVSALHKLHQRGYVHRDLKPDNYLYELIQGKFNLRLTDFEMTADATQSARLANQCGNALYLAPELAQLYLSKDTTVPSLGSLQRAEIWSLGVILWAILYAGEIPKSLKAVLHSMENGEDVTVQVQQLLELLDSSTKAAKEHEKILADLPNKGPYHKATAACLQLDPSKRPTTGKILEMIGQKVADDGKSEKT